MRCPICKAHTVVLDTRDEKRRRECFNMHRFTTVETVVKKPAPEPKRKATA